MDMSRAALPPVNAPINESDRKHPRFREYMEYRNGMARLMVNCESFENWLRSRLAEENCAPVVFQVRPWKVPVCERPDGWLSPGWYKHLFSYSKTNGREVTERLGPFVTREEAESA